MLSYTIHKLYKYASSRVVALVTSATSVLHLIAVSPMCLHCMLQTVFYAAAAAAAATVGRFEAHATAQYITTRCKLQRAANSNRWLTCCKLQQVADDACVCVCQRAANSNRWLPLLLACSGCNGDSPLVTTSSATSASGASHLYQCTDCCMHSSSISSSSSSNSSSDRVSIEDTAVLLLCGSCLQTRHEVSATSVATSAATSVPQHDDVKEMSYWPLAAVLAREVRYHTTLT
jgi:hypothetical protein